MERREFLAGLAALAGGVYGDEKGKIRVEAVDKDLDWGPKDGLYSTFLGVHLGYYGKKMEFSHSGWATKVINEHKRGGLTKIEEVGLRYKNEFGKDVEVKTRVVKQGGKAPLVIIVPGMGGKAEGSNEIMAALGSAGYHVVSGDSSFNSAMVEKGLYGVPGNLENETMFLTRMVDDSVKARGIEFSKVGAIGKSYGATEALLLSKLSEEKKLPFRVSRVQAHCPPISMRATMDLLDRKHKEAMDNIDDNNNLIKLAGDYIMNLPVQQDAPANFNRDRAGWFLGRAFNYFLANTTYAIFKRYPEIRDRVVPKDVYRGVDEMGKADMEKSYCEAMSYGNLRDLMVKPYWEKRGVSMESILDNGDISKILPGVRGSVELVITVDDPINEPGAVEALEGIKSGAKMTKLLRGGHCGYLCNEWALAKMLSVFD